MFTHKTHHLRFCGHRSDWYESTATTMACSNSNSNTTAANKQQASNSKKKKKNRQFYRIYSFLHCLRQQSASERIIRPSHMHTIWTETRTRPKISIIYANGYGWARHTKRQHISPRSFCCWFRAHICNNKVAEWQRNKCKWHADKYTQIINKSVAVCVLVPLGWRFLLLCVYVYAVLWHNSKNANSGTFMSGFRFAFASRATKMWTPKRQKIK